MVVMGGGVDTIGVVGTGVVEGMVTVVVCSGVTMGIEAVVDVKGIAVVRRVVSIGVTDVEVVE